MRDLAILTFLSLDGVMQAPTLPEEDQSGGLTGGGWARSYWERAMPAVMSEAMAEPYDLLFGCKTYEIFAGHWPKAPKDDAVARKLNGARK